MSRIQGPGVPHDFSIDAAAAASQSAAASQAGAAGSAAAEGGLALGARGADVKALQEQLADLGYKVAGGADAVYGRGTATAVAAFQKKAGLPPTGAADAATLDKLAAAAGPKVPPVATAAKGFVDAYGHASAAMSQMDMVAGSVEINDAADALLRRAAGELSAQLADRGKDAKADAVLADLEKFFAQVGPARGYRVDPERGSMASLEDNGDRQAKVMAKLAKVAAELGKVNKEPNGEFQQAYNRHAGGEAVRQEALFAIAFQKAYDKDADPKVLADAEKFLAALPKKVDAQIESRGGTLEPLERAGATSQALAEMAKKLSATK